MRTLQRVITGIAWANINTKMKLLLLASTVILPLGLLVTSEYLTRAEMNNIIVLWAVTAIILLLPLAHISSNLLVLRSIKELNTLCLEIKSGNLEPFSELPKAPEGSDALQTLKHNMFWMGHVLNSRQRVLLVAKANLEHTQSQLQESIEYAGRIQKAFLPAQQELDDIFSDYFLLWEQRDGVGGDSYWIKKTQNGFFIATIDCTGHGVPGAFMTLIVQALFDRMPVQQAEEDPARLLALMNIAIKNALSSPMPSSRTGEATASGEHCILAHPPDDGMDCTLLYIDNQQSRLVFAGARNTLFIRSSDGTVEEIKGDRNGVGNARHSADGQFTNHVRTIRDGMRFYTLTDGLIDQIGGPRRLPFGKKRFAAFIAEQERPLHKQKTHLKKMLQTHQGKEARRDDIMVMGFALKQVTQTASVRGTHEQDTA